MLGFDVTLWIGGAIIVVGLTQYIKGMIKPYVPNKCARVVYSLLSACLAFVVGYFGGGTPIIWNCLGILVFSQLGYEYILQVIEKKLKGTPDKDFVDKISDAATIMEDKK